MNRRQFLYAGAAAGLSAYWAVPSPADAPPKAAPKADPDAQDLVYFAESRPVLLRLKVNVDGRPLSAAWEEYVTKVFKYLDADIDGFLNKIEAQRVPAPGVLFGGDYNAGTPTLSELDTDGDGRVSRDELAAYFRRHGALPFQVPGGGQGADVWYTDLALRPVLIDQLDAEIELLELQDDLAFFAQDGVVLGRGGRRGASTDALNDALFKLLDTNGDGKLSKEELAAAPAVLLKLDRNDDEMITPDEILPGRGRGSNNYTTAVRLYSYYGADRNRGNGPFWLAHAGASKAELARRLQQTYAKGDAKGPAPTKLARKNLSLDEATFAKLDVDGDGFLDAEELARFAQRPPDLELQIDLGAKASLRLVKHGGPLEANVRAGKDGVLMLEMDGTRLDLKALAAQKIDGADAAKQEREQYVKAFKEADRDNNGYLDMSEAMRSPVYRNLFKLMDRDGDGKLFEKEVLAYLDAYQELQAAARLSCASVGIASEGKGLFEMLDTDGDGRLSVREMRNAVRLIVELDRDGDGMISRNEIPRCSQATFHMGPPSGGGEVYGDYYTAVAFVDGRVGRGRQRPAKPPRGPEWFRKMDRNGDGDVSRREFLGTDAQFRAIDTDGDGLISVEEAEAYDKKVRERRDQK